MREPLALALGLLYSAPLTSASEAFHGEVAEWSIAPHSKCGVRASVPGVRIPPSPPFAVDVIEMFFLLANHSHNCSTIERRLCHFPRYRTDWPAAGFVDARLS